MAPEKVTDMVLNVDLKCRHCYKKVRRILGQIHHVSNQVYNEKLDTVNITVCCSPEKIRDRIAKKGGKAIRSIEIKEASKPIPAVDNKPKEEAKSSTDKPKGDEKPKAEDEKKPKADDEKPKAGDEKKQPKADEQKPKAEDEKKQPKADDQKPKAGDEKQQPKADEQKPKAEDEKKQPKADEQKPKAGDEKKPKGDEKPKEAIAVPVPYPIAIPSPVPASAVIAQAPMGYPYYVQAPPSYHQPDEPSTEFGNNWKPVPISDNYGYFGYSQGPYNEENPSGCQIM